MALSRRQNIDVWCARWHLFKNMKFYYFICLLFSCHLFFGNARGALLKTIISQDVATFSKLNEYLLVLFVEPDCKPCKDAELILSQLSAEMIDSLVDVTYVKVSTNDIPKKSGINSTPIIMFYRHQRPVIYDGPTEAESIESWITFNKQISMKILNDEDFEHLTQAASGATTGDWLVLFCNSQVETCKHLEPIFETVASKLKNQKIVAFVDISTSPGLVRRFALKDGINIRFFRLGKMYSYSLDKLDIDSLILFVQGWYKNMTPVNVPTAPSPFDSLVIIGVDLLKEYAWLKWVVPLCFIAVILMVFFGGKKTKDGKKDFKNK